MPRQPYYKPQYLDAFAQRLRLLRSLRGMTQEQLAEASQLSYEHVNKLERGGVGPSFATICALAEALGTEPIDMFFFSDGEDALAKDASPEDTPAFNWFQFLQYSGYWSWDTATGSMEWSDGVYRLFGLEPGRVPPSMQLVMERLSAQDQEKLELLRPRAGMAGGRERFFLRLLGAGESKRLLLAQVISVQAGEGGTIRGMFFDVTGLQRLESSMIRSERDLEAIAGGRDKPRDRIEWFTPHAPGAGAPAHFWNAPSDGTSSRPLLEAVGNDALKHIAGDYLRMLGTCTAVFEANGECDLGLCVSPWCRLLSVASRESCGTQDDAEAMRGGEWHCYESCWSDAGRECMRTGNPVEAPCRGGLRIFATPVLAGSEPVGAICLGYGPPPTDAATLSEVASRYGVGVDELLCVAAEYEKPPQALTEAAKRSLDTTARLIGRMIESRAAEMEPVPSRHHMQGLYERSSIGVVLADAQGRITRCNDCFAKLLDFQPPELVGKSLADLTHPDDLERETRLADKALSSGQLSYHLEKRYRGKGGRDIWAESIVSMVRAGNWGIESSLTLAIDISPLKHREQAKRELAMELESLYSLSRIAEETDSVDELLSRFVREVPPAGMQQPEDTLVRIHFDGQTFENKKGAFAQSLRLPIIVNGVQRGDLTMGYSRIMGCIKKHEAHLVEEYAKRLPRLVRMHEAEQALRKNGRRRQHRTP